MYRDFVSASKISDKVRLAIDGLLSLDAVDNERKEYISFIRSHPAPVMSRIIDNCNQIQDVNNVIAKNCNHAHGNGNAISQISCNNAAIPQKNYQNPDNNKYISLISQILDIISPDEVSLDRYILKAGRAGNAFLVMFFLLEKKRRFGFESPSALDLPTRLKLSEWKAMKEGEGDDKGKRGNSAGDGLETIDFSDILTYHRDNKNKNDLKNFLRRFTVEKEEMRIDTGCLDYIPYTFGLQYYGNMPLVEFSESSIGNRVEELVIAIDTSGSCTSEVVCSFLGEVYALLSDDGNFFDDMNVYIIQCDLVVQDVQCIKNHKEWLKYMENIHIHGRGGTDFTPVFLEVEKMREDGLIKDLKGLLYFTDGDGIYPDKETDYTTAFVFMNEKEGHPKVPEWAVQIRL